MTDQTEFFRALEADVRRMTLEQSRVVRARKGQTVLSHGVHSTEVFFVLEGSLIVMLYSSDGREVSLRDLAVGEMFGELAAIDGKSRSASIVAQDDSRLLAVSQTAFATAVSSTPAAATWLNRHLAAQIRAQTDRIFELSALNVRARLHCELLRLARNTLDQPGAVQIRPAPTHAALASRIGANREAVTREMRALVERNILKGGRRCLEFLDLAKLENAVQRLSADGPSSPQSDHQ